MGKESRRRRDNRNNQQSGWVSTTLIRFDEPDADADGFVMSKDTQFILPNGTEMQKGVTYTSQELGLDKITYGKGDNISNINLNDYDLVSDEYGVYAYPKGTVWNKK